jgi:hypothetical protein
VFRDTEIIAVKSQFKSLSGEGGSVLTHHKSCGRKQTTNATLAMDHQADPTHSYKFSILQQICNTQYFTILFWDWGRRQKARIDSQRYEEEKKGENIQTKESKGKEKDKMGSKRVK